MAMASIRPATPLDAGVVAALHREIWRAAYAALLPDSVLAELDAPEVEAAWADALSGRSVVVIAAEGDTDVGFCVAGPAPEDEIASASGELPSDAHSVGLISSLLVLPRWARRGHGGRLIATVAAELERQGSTRGVAWAPARDAATLGFYRRIGWEPDGTARTLEADGHQLRELRLTGSLDMRLVD